MKYYVDNKYNFFELFNEETGFLIRSNIIINGVQSNIQPIMRSFPELIDVGIMGNCISGKTGLCRAAGIDCYQNAVQNHRPNMPLEGYNTILKQAAGKTFQIALGGAGDPNKHECFEEILWNTRKHNIVPNMTTSGFEISEHEISLIKKYCGAVAVSYYSKLDKSGLETNPLTISAINKLVSKGCITNIHYVLSTDNVNEALYRVQNHLFPSGINAVIFLLYKPVGQGKPEKMLTANHPIYLKLLHEIANNSHPFKIGFDSCQSPAIKTFCPSIAVESIEFCESARFSMYIDCELQAYPCSFGHKNQDYAVSLIHSTIDDAWNSTQFNLFRERQISICKACSEKISCRNCALDIGMNVCGKTPNI